MTTRRRLTSNLALLIAGASVGATLPSMALASLTEERPSVERTDVSRERRAGRQAPVELAAKKKKKKGARKSAPSSSGGAAAAPDDDGDKSGSDDAAASGASDQEVQRAARVAPTDSGDSGGGGGSSARAKKPTVGIEAEGGAGSSSPGPAQRFLDVSIGGYAFARSLTYNEAPQSSLREYQPRLLGGATAGILYYPGAQFSSGFITNLGLDINVAQAFGVSSRTPDGSTYPTQVHDYNGGVRVRFPLDNLEPSLTVGFGDHAFKFTGANRAALLLPDTQYQYVRAVAGIRVPLPSNLSFFAEGGYRHVLSAGQIKTDYFKNLTVAGVEADAFLAYAITSNIEARAGVDFRRYFYSMHAKNGDPYIVGGAVDQTIAGSLSLAVTLGGADQARGSAAEATAPSGGGGDGDADVKVTRKKSSRRSKSDATSDADSAGAGKE